MTKQISNTDKRPSWSLFAILFSCIGVYAFLQIVHDARSSSIPAHEKRSVADMSKVEYLWHQDLQTYRSRIDEDGASRSRVFIDVIDNQVILPTENTNWLLFRDEFLSSFDLLTGNLKWQFEIDSRNEFRNYAVTSNEQQLFIFMSKIRGVQAYVSAIDSTGRTAWTTHLPNLSFVQEFRADENILSYRGQGQKGANYSEISFDVLTGSQMPYIRIPFPLSDPLDYQLLAQQLGYEGDAYGFSNNELIFLMTIDDSTVWIMNRYSEEFLGNIVFDQAPLAVDGLFTYEVFYENGFLIIYFGDSHQLFAFRVDPAIIAEESPVKQK